MTKHRTVLNLAPQGIELSLRGYKNIFQFQCLVIRLWSLIMKHTSIYNEFRPPTTLVIFFLRKHSLNGPPNSSIPSRCCKSKVLFYKILDILKGTIHKASNLECLLGSRCCASHFNTRSPT